jgi:hypothetical protein
MSYPGRLAEVGTLSVIAITLCYVFASSYNALTLSRNVIASISYQSEHIGAVITSYNYHLKLIDSIVISISYCFPYLDLLFNFSNLLM